MTPTRRIAIAIAAALLLAPAVPPATDAQAPPVKVGFSSAMTGPSAITGEGVKWAAQMLADEYNAKGGIAGRKIELYFGDNAGTPGEAPAEESSGPAPEVVTVRAGSLAELVDDLLAALGFPGTTARDLTLLGSGAAGVTLLPKMMEHPEPCGVNWITRKSLPLSKSASSRHPSFV